MKFRKPLIVLNLKTYQESLGAGALEMCRVADEVAKAKGASMIVAPQTVDLAGIAASVSIPVFAQHADAHEQGAHTGSVSLESLKSIGCKGTLLNHSERKLEFGVLKQTIERAKKVGIEALACAASTKEAVAIAGLVPDYIAVEPPELIGSGISVSTAKPEIVVNTVKAVKEVADVPVLCGAGISNGNDVKKAVELGAEGVLLASAFVKAKDKKGLLLSFL